MNPVLLSMSLATPQRTASWATWWRTLGLLVAAMMALLLYGPAQAQRTGGYQGAQGYQGPAGYQVLRATYGLGWQGMDVTARVQQLTQQGQGFQASNDVFGADPAPGQRKVLIIEAREPNGRVRTLEFAESQWVDGHLFAATGGSAMLGRLGQHGAQQWHGNSQVLQASYGTRWQSIDVTARVSQAVDPGRGGFTVNNDFFGTDPAPGHRKMLNVQMRDRNGRMQSFDFPESSWVDAAQLAGSGSSYQPGGNRWQEDERYVPLTILRATYGDGPRQVDVTQQLRSRIQNGRLQLRVDNDLAGYDPFPNVRKRLYVEYSVGDSRQARQTVVEEKQYLNLP